MGLRRQAVVIPEESSLGTSGALWSPVVAGRLPSPDTALRRMVTVLFVVVVVVGPAATARTNFRPPQRTGRAPIGPSGPTHVPGPQARTCPVGLSYASARGPSVVLCGGPSRSLRRATGAPGGHRPRPGLPTVSTRRGRPDLGVGSSASEGSGRSRRRSRS